MPNYISTQPSDKEAYAGMADELNDGDVVFNPQDWNADALAAGKRHAERHDLAWPPVAGDFDRYCESKER